MTQLICAAVGCRYSSISPIYMSDDHLEHFNYHNNAFKRCMDVVSLGRLDRLWFFRHHWFLKIGWFGKKGVQGTNLLDRIVSVLGVLKLVQNSYFRSRPAIFQFSGALVYNYEKLSLPPNLCERHSKIHFFLFMNTKYWCHFISSAYALVCCPSSICC